MRLISFTFAAIASLGAGAIAVVVAFSSPKNMLILLMTFLIFLFSFLIIRLRYQRYGFNDPFLLFTLFFVLYNGLFPLQVAWNLSKGLLLSPLFPVEFTSDAYLKAAFASCLAAVGLCFAAVFVLTLPSKKTKQPNAVQSIVLTPWVGILVFLFGLALFILDFQRIGGFVYVLSLPRVDRLFLLAKLRHSLPYTPFLFAGLAWVWLYYARGRLSGFWAFGLLGLWCSLMVIQGDRRFLTYAILIAFATYAAVRYPKLRIKPKLFVCAFVSIFVVFAFFNQVRWLIQPLMSGEMSIGEAMEWVKRNASPAWLLPGVNEFAGPYFTLLYSIVHSYPTDTPLLGVSYLQAIPNLLPRSLYPGDKPLPLSFAFADLVHQTYMPWRESTIGWGYSPVAEAYNNFRLWGIPLVFFLIGLFWEWVARLRYKNWVGILLYALLIPQTLNLNRIDVAWSFQEGVYFAGALFFILVVRAVFLAPVFSRVKRFGKNPFSPTSVGLAPHPSDAFGRKSSPDGSENRFFEPSAGLGLRDWLAERFTVIR